MEEENIEQPSQVEAPAVEVPPQPDEQQPATAKDRSVWKSFLVETLQTILLAVVLYFLIDTVIGRVRVENISMEPTLMPGQFLIVNKLAYRIGDYNLGDVVVFHYPKNPAEDYIKRIIGVPGDVVKIEGGIVSVNGEAFDEEYIAAPPQYSGVWEVPEDNLFVLGDNRNQSSDSHSWGFVPEENVVGRALMVYWPLPDVKLLTQTPVAQAAAP